MLIIFFYFSFFFYIFLVYMLQLMLWTISLHYYLCLLLNYYKHTKKNTQTYFCSENLSHFYRESFMYVLRYRTIPTDCCLATIYASNSSLYQSAIAVDVAPTDVTSVAATAFGTVTTAWSRLSGECYVASSK